MKDLIKLKREQALRENKEDHSQESQVESMCFIIKNYTRLFTKDSTSTTTVAFFSMTFKQVSVSTVSVFFYFINGYMANEESYGRKRPRICMSSLKSYPSWVTL